MVELVANFCLVFLGISLIVTYMAVRLNWLKWEFAGLSGYLSSAMFLFLYSQLKGSPSIKAILIGLGVGLLFTAVAVVMGIFFRVNREA